MQQEQDDVHLRIEALPQLAPRQNAKLCRYEQTCVYAASIIQWR